MKAWLSLGSNMQQPAAQLRQALGSLSSAEGIEILKESGFYRTPPWGDEAAGRFYQCRCANRNEPGSHGTVTAVAIDRKQDGTATRTVAVGVRD